MELRTLICAISKKPIIISRLREMVNITVATFAAVHINLSFDLDSILH
jgi:hypothetical protein